MSVHCLCSSYYGLSVWFPDMIKYLQYEEYESKVKVFHRERVEHFTFNFTLANQIHKEGEYIDDKYAGVLSHTLMALPGSPRPAAAVLSGCGSCHNVQMRFRFAFKSRSMYDIVMQNV